MEPSGRNWWQLVAIGRGEKRPRQAKTLPWVATRCDGKECDEEGVGYVNPSVMLLGRIR